MPRDIIINGETLALVKGPSNSAIAALTELGLAETQMKLTFNLKHEDVKVDAWGTQIPVDVQWMLGSVDISMSLVHFSVATLGICTALSMGGAPALGSTGRAGQRLGNNLPRFAPGNSYIGLNLTSPVLNLPYRFFYTYMPQAPVVFPLGTQRSVVQVSFKAIPYTQDPYGGSASQPNTVYGTGAYGALIWDSVLDT